MRMLRCLRSENGTSVLEFAVVVPFLMIVFVVGAELSRAWFTANIVQNAVREGARMGAVTPDAPAGTAATVGQARITSILPSGLTLVSGPTVTCDHSPCQPDDKVQADVTVLFQSVAPVFIPDFSIHQSATMRYE